MTILISGKPSISKDRKRAQVTVTIGEGRNKRSVTRHIRRSGLKWLGLNPDKRAVPLNELYQDELTIAKSDLASAEAALQNLQKKLEKVEEAEPETAINVIGSPRPRRCSRP